MSSAHDRDTIFALASSPGKAAVALVRISGPACRKILLLITGKIPEPRRAVLQLLRDPECGETIDKALIFWFPGPASYTGEDSVELSVHGSRAVIARLFAILGGLPSVRIAAAGEFTRRALENGKVGLLEVESLADLLSAETEQQRRLGIAGMSGALHDEIQNWRLGLLDALVSIEGGLDFSDEADVSSCDGMRVIDSCRSILESMRSCLGSARRPELIRGGVSVLIAGPPNAGKSTLLNALAQRELAIVSEIPGTTRDLIEMRLDLNGYLVNVIDSAGIRSSLDRLESLGIQRALERSNRVELVLWLSDYREPVAPPKEMKQADVWQIHTKIDCKGESERIINFGHDGTTRRPDPLLQISATTGHNIPELLDKLSDYVGNLVTADGSEVVTNERQRQSLSHAIEPLAEIVNGVPYQEVVAECLRSAIHHLEILVGKISVEDVLGEIFSRFCIGK